MTDAVPGMAEIFCGAASELFEELAPLLSAEEMLLALVLDTGLAEDGLAGADGFEFPDEPPPPPPQDTKPPPHTKRQSAKMERDLLKNNVVFIAL